MSSILDQNPDATVSEALADVPEELISRRESLRMRALIGIVPVSLLAGYENTGLAKVLASEPDGKLADPTVRCGFTMPISPKRVPVIATFFLDYLRNGLHVVQEPAPDPAPVVPTIGSGSKSRKGRRADGPPRRGVEVTLADLRTDTLSRGRGSLANRDGGSKKPKPSPRGRPVGSPAELARIRHGIQE